MIRQQLHIKQQQKLSPLQIQQVKLLELNSLEIENRINQELEENPALEEIVDDNPIQSDENEAAEDLTLGDYLTEDDIPDYRLQQNYSQESKRTEIPFSETESFQDYLLGQIHLKELSEEELKVAEYIIGNVDPDGYLRRDLQAISDDLAFQYGIEISVDEIRTVLSIVQQLDPPGIGAANLQQCLLLQLERKESTPSRDIALSILDTYFDLFSKKQYDKVIKNLAISEEQLKEAIKEITLLNPRPGSAWESTMDTKMSQITPDFIVETINGELFFSMSDDRIPELKVSKEYGDMLQSYSTEKTNREKRDALLFVKQKLDSAKWFIDAIKQRNTTLRKTMLTIIDIQRDFFLTGDEANLKPMILKDVAERCSYDISTISRVSNSKYVQTNWGVYPLKYFFSESLLNEAGEEVSTREIKAILKECIAGEDKKKPLTDDALVKELKKRGYDIARRTIAKYREQLNIPVARLRKEI